MGYPSEIHVTGTQGNKLIGNIQFMEKVDLIDTDELLHDLLETIDDVGIISTYRDLIKTAIQILFNFKSFETYTTKMLQLEHEILLIESYFQGDLKITWRHVDSRMKEFVEARHGYTCYQRVLTIHKALNSVRSSFTCDQIHENAFVRHYFTEDFMKNLLTELTQLSAFFKRRLPKSEGTQTTSTETSSSRRHHYRRRHQRTT